jgi:hypothetical protein
VRDEGIVSIHRVRSDLEPRPCFMILAQDCLNTGSGHFDIESTSAVHSLERSHN